MKIRKVLVALGMACLLLAGTGGGLEAKGSRVSSSSSTKTVHVREYTRRDGTVVHAHDRAAPGTAAYSNPDAGTRTIQSTVEPGLKPRREETKTSLQQLFDSQLSQPLPKLVDPCPNCPPVNRHPDKAKWDEETLKNYWPGRLDPVRNSPGKTYKTAPSYSTVPTYHSTVERDSHGRFKRSGSAKHTFERTHPCPSTGRTTGGCPGYVIDHIQALKHGGTDSPSNMQWQTIAAAKAKDRTE
jgi:hypothetical protein